VELRRIEPLSSRVRPMRPSSGEVTRATLARMKARMK
jgi:hypothetical protein